MIICPKCKKVLKQRKGKRIICSCGEAIGPNSIQKIFNFTLATIKHVSKGIPTCTDEQIQKRLAICKECVYFTGSNCIHKRCGCNINDQQRFLNKLAWADQECPDGRWKQVPTMQEKD